MKLRHLENQPEGAAFAGNSVIRERKAVRSHQRSGHQHQVIVLNLGGKYGITRIIGRSAVRVDHHRGQLGKVLRQAGVDGSHHMSDRPRIVVARDSDHDIRVTDRIDRPVCFRRQRALPMRPL